VALAARTIDEVGEVCKGRDGSLVADEALAGECHVGQAAELACAGRHEAKDLRAMARMGSAGRKGNNVNGRLAQELSVWPLRATVAVGATGGVLSCQAVDRHTRACLCLWRRYRKLCYAIRSVVLDCRRPSCLCCVLHRRMLPAACSWFTWPCGMGVVSLRLVGL
jgi:hypothetical protein